jgi:hypothetical protein
MRPPPKTSQQRSQVNGQVNESHEPWPPYPFPPYGMYPPGFAQPPYPHPPWPTMPMFPHPYASFPHVGAPVPALAAPELAPAQATPVPEATQPRATSPAKEVPDLEITDIIYPSLSDWLKGLDANRSEQQDPYYAYAERFTSEGFETIWDLTDTKFMTPSSMVNLFNMKIGHAIALQRLAIKEVERLQRNHKQKMQ